jgi:hypothetical protein
MANRNDPDVRQHETLPGLSPAPGRSLSLPSGARPVEQIVDAAIERIAIERTAIERSANEHRLSHYEYAHEHAQPPSSKATRLRWKGLDVSDEFREYAERVARGEDLPPFEGRVLAEPNAAFPWGPLSRSEPPAVVPATAPEHPGRAGQVALWASAAIVMGLLGWSVALKLRAIDPPGELATVTAADDPSTIEPLVAPVASAPVLVPASEPEVGARVETPPENVMAALSEPVPVPAEPVTPPPPAAPALAVSVAAAAEPLAAAPVVATPVTVATPAVVAPPAAKPTASPRLDPDIHPDMDFGIDELPLPSGAGAAAKGPLSEPGNIGDSARVSQQGGGAARKEPGSESSAKGSLLVEKPSF